MEKIIEHILLYGLTPAVICISGGVIILHVFKKFYENDLSRRIELVKSELHLELEKQKTNYNFVFEERANILKKLYQLIEDLTITNDANKTFDINIRDHLAKIEEFFLFYKYNRLFINSETCMILDGFVDKLQNLSELINSIYSRSKSEKKRSIEETEKFNKIINSDLVELKNTLELEFKRVFGINN